MGRLKWKPSREIDSQFGVKLEKESDVERHRIIVEYEIMHVLINNPDGIGILELAKLVGIDRSNIGTYLNKLIKTGYVKRSAGLQGKYFPTDKIFKNPILSSRLMAEFFASEVLARPNLIIGDLKSNPYSVEFRTLPPYLQKEEFGLPCVMFELANKIGAYIMYALIQAMSPSNENVQGVKYMRKDVIIQEVVRYSIAPIIPWLLSTFKDSVRSELKSLIGEARDPLGRFIDYGWTIPEFQLKKDVIDELMFVYSSMFPTMYAELEKLRTRLPLLMRAHDYHKQYLQMQEEFQKNCKHSYVDDVSRLIESDGKKFWTKYHKSSERGKSIVHCIKCHHTTYQKFVTNCQHKTYEKFLK